ncbi:MAG: translocation/assembly module TamB domain-containing protein [Ferruginibacter sp.]
MSIKRLAKKITKLILYIVGFVLLLVIAAWIFINTGYGKRVIKDKVVAFLEKKLNTKVQVGSIDYSIPKWIEIKGVYIEDQKKDTLLYGEQLSVDLDMIKLIRGITHIRQVKLKNIYASIYRPANDSFFNYQFILNAFQPAEETTQTAKDTTALDITLEKLLLNSVALNFKDDFGGSSFYTKVNQLDASLNKFQPDKFIFAIDKLNTDSLVFNMVTAKAGTADKSSSVIDLLLSANEIGLKKIHVTMDDRVSGMYYGNNIQQLSATKVNFDMAKEKATVDKIILDSSFIKFVLPKPAAGKTSDTLTPSSAWSFTANEISMRQNNIEFDDNNTMPVKEGLDYTHLNLNDIHTRVKSINYTPDSIAAVVEQLSFADKSGFKLDTTHANILYSKTGVTVAELYVKTPQSIIQNNIAVKYNDITQLTTAPQNSAVAIKLNNSVIAVNDLYLLMPALKKQLPPQQFANNKIQLNTEMTGSLQRLDIPYLQLSGLSGTSISAKAILYNITDTNRLAYDITILNSNLPKQDIVKFMPAGSNTASIPAAINLSTHLTGNLKNVTAGIDARSNNFRFTGKGSIQNFDKPAALKYNITVTDSRIEKSFIDAFVPDTLYSGFISLPAVMVVKGTAKGDMNNVQPDLRLAGSYGNAAVKGSLNNFKNPAAAVYDLHLTTNGFELGKLLKNDSMLGKITMTAAAKGKGFDYKTMKAGISAHITSAGFNKYDYKNAVLEATLGEGLVKTNGSINDAAVQLTYDLNADVKGNYPTNVNAVITIDTVQLKKLNLYADTLNASSTIYFTAASLDPEAPSVNLVIDSSRITVKKRNHFIDSIAASAHTTAGVNDISLVSPFADLSAKGKFRYDAIGNSLLQYIDRYYDITDEAQVQSPPQQVSFNGVIKKHSLITDLADSLLYDEIKFDGSYASDLSDSALQLNASIPFLQYQTNTVEKATLSVSSNTQQINGSIDFGRLQAGSNTLYATSIHAAAFHDSLGIAGVTKDENNKERFAIGADITKKDKEYTFSLKDTLLLNYKDWTVAPNNKIIYSPQGILVNNFLITRAEEKISIASRQNQLNAPIDANIENFRIQDITTLFNSDTLFAAGILNGKFSVSEFDKKIPAFTGNISLTEFELMQQPVGNIQLDTRKQDDNTITGSIALSGNGNAVSVNGNYFLNNDEQQFDASMKIDTLKMRTLQAFSGGSLANSSGAVTGNIAINGKFTDPRWKGALQFDTTKFTLTSLGSTYTIDKQKIMLDYPLLSLDKFTIKDTTNNSIVIDGNIKSNTLTDYDLSLNIDANNFIVVNSPKAINNQVYGFAAVNADISVTGNSVSPDIQGSLSLTDKSDVTLVLPERNINKDAAVSVVRFIDQDTFALPEKAGFLPELAAKPSADFAKFLNYNLNIEASKKAALTIIIDPSSGDELKVQGDAQLNAGVDPGGNIVLAGTYELNNGYYELNYQFLKKRFNLLPGSTIAFSGNPLNAEVNISAEYVINTSAKDLLGNEVGEADPKVSNTFNQKIPFRVLLYLKGPMGKPEISFDIQLPDENTAGINNQLRSTIDNKLAQLKGDVAATNKQVFSLLLLNRFSGEQSTDFFKGSGGGGDLTDVARESVSKFLSSALDQIAADLFKGVDVNLDLNTYKDYSSGDAQQRTDLNVAVSKSFADDRISITVGKNFGIEGQDATAKSTQQRNNSYLPDVTLNYKLTKDGKYMLRVYKKDQFEVILDGYVVETGIAFILTMDYDKFSELFSKRK